MELSVAMQRLWWGMKQNLMSSPNICINPAQTLTHWVTLGLLFYVNQQMNHQDSTSRVRSICFRNVCFNIICVHFSINFLPQWQLIRTLECVRCDFVHAFACACAVSMFLVTVQKLCSSCFYVPLLFNNKNNGKCVGPSSDHFKFNQSQKKMSTTNVSNSGDRKWKRIVHTYSVSNGSCNKNKNNNEINVSAFVIWLWCNESCVA